MTPMTHLNRVAVVTGAAGGIGQAVCRHLAARGANVVAVDLQDPVETLGLLEAAGHKGLGLRADVSDPDQTRLVGDEVRRLRGRCDILVNNAGIYPRFDIDELDYATWRRVPAVNLDSQFLMVKALLPLMKQGGWGRIVNLTSNSIGLAQPGVAHYMASKMGVIGFTRGLANDVAGFGITVNAVGPTMTRTPGILSAVPEAAQQAIAQLQAIKRAGEPEDVAGTIAFLTGEDSSFVTGQTIMADGGLMRL